MVFFFGISYSNWSSIKSNRTTKSLQSMLHYIPMKGDDIIEMLHDLFKVTERAKDNIIQARKKYPRSLVGPTSSGS